MSSLLLCNQLTSLSCLSYPPSVSGYLSPHSSFLYGPGDNHQCSSTEPQRYFARCQVLETCFSLVDLTLPGVQTRGLILYIWNSALESEEEPSVIVTNRIVYSATFSDTSTLLLNLTLTFYIWFLWIVNALKLMSKLSQNTGGKLHFVSRTTLN